MSYVHYKFAWLTRIALHTMAQARVKRNQEQRIRILAAYDRTRCECKIKLTMRTKSQEQAYQPEIYEEKETHGIKNQSIGILLNGYYYRLHLSLLHNSLFSQVSDC